MSPDAEPLGRERTDGVLALTLRGAGSRVPLALLEDLRDVLRAAAEEDALRVLVLQGEGADFSLGADLRDPRLAAAVLGGETSRRALATLGQDVVDALATLPVPTVVAARGRILGAGACFFTVGDFRLAAHDASLGFPEIDRGMHLSWGILPRMVRAYGHATSARLAMLGDPLPVSTLGAAVTLVDDPDSAARALSRRLADKPALAMRSIVAVQRSGDARDDAARFAASVASPDFAAAMSAFLGGTRTTGGRTGS